MKKLTITLLAALALGFSAGAQDYIDEEQQQDTINVAVLIPFKADTAPNNQAFDFYSGALEAVKEKASDGIPVRINVFDSAAGKEFSTEELKSYDFMIGPFAANDIREIALQMPWRKYVISPLDPACNVFADSLRVIQTPVSASWQYNQLASWAIEESRDGDAFLIVHEPGMCTDMVESFSEKFTDEGISSKVVKCTTDEEIATVIQGFCKKGVTTRLFLASEKDTFLTRLLEEVANVSGDRNIITYAPAKVRGLKNIEAEILGKTALRIVSGYYVDEKDSKVQAFTNRYVDSYKSKPSSFAYQGYDIMNFFLQIRKDYGRSWARHIEDYNISGLQTDFMFIDYTFGFVNAATRRIKYNSEGKPERAN